jgi:hypothetical protein
MHQNERPLTSLSFFKKYIFHKSIKKVKQRITLRVGMHKSAAIFEASARVKADEKKQLTSR